MVFNWLGLPQGTLGDRLTRTNAMGHRARVRAGALQGALGFAFIATGLSLTVLFYTQDRQARMTTGGFAAFTGVPGLLIVGLSHLPNDVRKVRTLVQNLRAFLLVIAVASTVMTYARENTSSRTVLRCDFADRADVDWRCGLAIGVNAYTLLCTLAAWLALGPGLRTDPKVAPPLCSSETAAILRQQLDNFRADYGRTALYIALFAPGSSGQVLAFGVPPTPVFWLAGHPGYFQMPPRATLQLAWKVARLFALMWALPVIAIIAIASTEREDDFDVAWLLFVAILLFVVLLPTPDNRRRFHAFVSRFTQTPEERQAREATLPRTPWRARAHTRRAPAASRRGPRSVGRVA